MANRRRERRELHSPAKMVYGLLQCLHHLSILTDGVGAAARAFNRKARELDGFIRPALPTEKVRQAIRSVNDTCAQEWTRVLITHYKDELDETRGALSAMRLSNSELTQATNTARNWGFRNYNRKLKASTVAELEKIMKFLFSAKPNNPVEKPSDPVQKPNGPVAKPNPGSTGEAEDASAGAARVSTSQKRRHSDPPSVQSETSPSQTQPSKRAAVVSSSQPSGPTQPKDAGWTTQTSKKRQRSTTPTISPSQIQTPKRHREEDFPPLSEPVSTPPAAAKSTPSGPSTSTEAPRKLSYSGAINSPPRTEPKPAAPSTPVKRFRNLPHAARGSRIHEFWEIPRITKDILILGTSNMSRISKVSNKTAQILSYPGLRIAQMLTLLQAYKYGPGSENASVVKPRKIVFSMGLNDRGISAQTSIFNLKKILIQTRKLFPDSQIFFHQVRYDSRLNINERRCLDKINKHLEEFTENKDNCSVIPPISNKHFKVGSDFIHWTEHCANETAKHIFSHLN